MLFELDDAEKWKKARKRNWKSTVYKNILKSIVQHPVFGASTPASQSYMKKAHMPIETGCEEY